MANLTSDQARQLSNNFLDLSRAIADFRYEQWEKLSFEENKKLSDIQHSLLRKGEDMLAASTSLIMDEVADSLYKINTVSEDIKATIKTLGNIQKVLNTAAALLTLGVAIVTRDTHSIGYSIKGVLATWNGNIL